jgi:hypothetical protein
MDGRQGDIDQKELAYFMGKVDSQLTQILAILQKQETKREEDRKDLDRVDKLTTQHEVDIANLKDWKDEMGLPEDFITHSYIRANYTTKIIVGVALFFLTTVVPAVLILIRGGI